MTQAKVIPTALGAMERNMGGANLNDEAALVSGWASPSSRDWKDTPGMATEAVNPDGSERDRTDQLPRQVAQISGWVSPTSQDCSRGGLPARPHDAGIPLTQQVAGLVGYLTARNNNAHGYGNPLRGEDGANCRLEDTAAMVDQTSGWSTPRSTDGEKGGGRT